MTGVADGAIGLLGAALLHGTLLAIVALILTATVLRRARPGVVAALWTVVLLKFLVPVGPGARFSLASVIDHLRAESAPAAVVRVTAPSSAVAPARRPAPSTPWGSLALTGLWLTGAAAVAFRQVRAARRARAQAGAAALAPAWLAAEVVELAAQVGVRSVVAVRVSDRDTSPYLVGLRAPIVVVPAAALADDRADARRAALVHELAHVRRGDAALRVLQALAATAFWFFPVVRWINRRLDLAREQACDAYAIAIGPLGATAYARMLVEAARARLEAPAAGLALARRGQLRRRVDALVARPARAGLGRPGLIVVGAWGLVGLTGADASARAARTPAPRVCLFTPEVATSIMAAYPEADVDGDGALSRAEVCEFQLAMRSRGPEEASTSTPADELALGLGPDAVMASALASDDLCCNCPDPATGGASSHLTAGAPATDLTPIPTCARGVDP